MSKNKLRDLPPEIWCQVFEFIEFKELCQSTSLVSRAFFSYFCESKNKKYAEVLARFGRCCGGIKKCNELLYLGDLSVHNEMKKIQPTVICKMCQRPKKKNGKAMFYFPVLKESRSEVFARLIEFIREKVCAPGMYASKAMLEGYKQNVRRFLVLKFGIRWEEKHQKEFVSLCEWSGRNAQLKLERSSKNK
ncbi:hypothetical protein D1R32_gp352 [Tunisvirus fontaine2]|uniref:F-box domain-containing protein n=1 Tax=Tunisvirus fontaine2 TaxID=1421067 RepID=V9SGQ1_9VIRU|nr:hypothetical protein D1R32_gp352 [Tunisvirus fontaine2]AHC55069.1 hypothetical protein TNS_ORF351 [Tunisvirus fontaine2]